MKLLMVLIISLLLLTACTTNSEPNMLFEPSVPFEVSNSTYFISPSSVDCAHGVVCYSYRGNSLSCTYTEQNIKECEQ